MNHGPRVAVVTGAAAGIGRAYAERLAADGLVVAVVDRAPPEDTVAGIAAAGGTAAGFAADVTDPRAVEECVASICSTSACIAGANCADRSPPSDGIAYTACTGCPARTFGVRSVDPSVPHQAVVCAVPP